MKPTKIPFGKYKDMPIESLSQDKNYINWLLAQNWFAEKYRDLHTIIINNFQEPTDTPEHNALQALFLDDGFCHKFVKIVLREIIPKIERIDIWSQEYKEWEFRIIENPEMMEEFKSRIYRKEFEVDGIDVILDYGFSLLAAMCNWSKKEEIGSYNARRSFLIEIKPSVGDDYPSVLRQMQSMQTSILFLEKFTGSGITEEQFIEIFNNQKRTVVFRRDVGD